MLKRKPRSVAPAVGALWLVVFSLVLAPFLSPDGFSQVVPNPGILPGIQTGSWPWKAEIEHLLSRLETVNLPALSAEGDALHIHQHLDIVINGTPVTVPEGIGIDESAGFISPIHTHDTSGVIHVESNERGDYTLGQFFDVWGVRFTKECIGGYCRKGKSLLKVFLNGRPVTGDPRLLPLGSLQEIAVLYGPANTIKSAPSTYRFAPGL